MNIYEFAIKMEQDGKSYYEKLAKSSSLPGLRTIFARLAADEQEHLEIFLALRDGAEAIDRANSLTLDFAQNVFAALLKEGGETVKGDLESYRHAMQLEADSFRLYQDAALKEKRPGVKALLLKIAGEERNHFQILENIFAYVNAPNQYLAWGEFSNLEEFRNFGRKIDR